MAAIQLFQLLKPKLGERETAALINFVDLKAKTTRQEIQEDNLKTLATKQDLWAVKDELKGNIASLRDELKGEMSSLRVELKEEISRLGVKIGEVRSDMVRWVFAVFVPLMLAIIGLYFKH